MPAGNLAVGERGFTNDPSRVEEWRGAFDAALGFASAVACPAINVFGWLPRADQLRQVRENLAWALPRAHDAGRTLLIEVLNPTETPRYLLTALASAVDFVEEVADPRLRLQFDTYTSQRLARMSRHAWSNSSR